MAGEYIESGEVVKPSCLIQLKKIGLPMSCVPAWIEWIIGKVWKAGRMR